jgi:hypothetical protein
VLCGPGQHLDAIDVEEADRRGLRQDAVDAVELQGHRALGRAGRHVAALPRMSMEKPPGWAVTWTLGVDWKTWEMLVDRLAAQLGAVDHLHRRRDLLQVLGLARGRDDDFGQLGLLLDRGGAPGSVRGWRYGLPLRAG